MLMSCDNLTVDSMDDLRRTAQQLASHPTTAASCRVVPRFRRSVRGVYATLTRVSIVAMLGCAAPHVFAPGDDQAIRGVIAAQADAWNKGDLEGYMAGYLKSDQLVFTSGGHIRHGWQETFDKYRAKYGSDRTTMGHLTFELLSVQPLGADGAIVLGRWKLTDTPNAGGGVFSLALARMPDGWRVVHDHTSADTP
jgi:ketosteroid isomerase-like protein